MKTGLLFAALAAAMLGAVQVNAQDNTAGKALYDSSCRSCHGPTARGMASFPKLRGQTAEYLVGRLEQYRAGESVGPNSALMVPRARDLSDDAIAEVSAYIAESFN